MKTLLIALILLTTTTALAAPSVTGVTGTVSNGQQITVAGSNFGAGPTVLLFDNFESGTVGQNIKTGAGSATVGVWDSLNTVPPKYSSDTAVSGSKAFKATTADGVEGQTNAMIALPDVTETFMSWWCYVPADSPWSGEEAGNNFNWKIFWLMQNDTVDNDLYFVKISAANHVVSGNNSTLAYPDTEYWVSSSMSKGAWHRYWWWVKDGYSNDGTIKVWELTASGPINVKTITNKTTLFPSAVRKKLSVNGYTKKMTYTQATQMFDDVYVATGPNAQARVEIGNAPVYANCTNLTILTANSWGAGTVTATVNQGSFANGSPAYLYVVDAAGNVSNGQLISFGGTDTTPPVSASSLASGRHQTTQTLALTSEPGATVKYCRGAGCTPATTYSAPVKALQNVAAEVIGYASTDGAGNVEATNYVVLRKQTRKKP